MNLKQTLKKLWECERGFVVSSELVFMSAILVLGLVVGLATVRDQVVQEFGDTSIGVGAMNQSYSFAGVVSPVGSSPGSAFDDSVDFCEVFGFDPVNASPACINLNVAVHPPVF